MNSSQAKRPFILLIVILASLTAFAPLSIDMYLPAFPQIADVFGVEVAYVEFSLASFFVGLSLGQLLYGSVTDRFGRKRPLYVGLSIYCIASILCAMSQSVDALIALRFFQALGACAGIVIARATVRDLFDHSESARVFSLLMLVMGVAPILAPLVGGYLALAFGWRAIFVVVAIVGAVVLTAVWRCLPETREPDPRVRLSSTFAIYSKILRDRNFLAFTLAGGFAQAGLFAYITGSPFVFIELFGIPSEHFGWVFGSNALGLIAMSQVNGRLVRNFHPTQILKVVLALVATLGVLLFAAAYLRFGFWGIAVSVFLFVASLGAIFPNANAGALAEFPHSAGSASALLGSLQYVLAALSSAAVSHFNDGTATSMTATIAVCSIAAFSVFFLVARPSAKPFEVSDAHTTVG